MILRLLLAMDRQALQRRYKKLLSDLDVLVTSPKGRKHLWDRIARETCDVVMIHASMLPADLDEKLQRFKSLIHSPSLVILSDREDPEQRAKLLAAGCDAVLNESLPEQELKEVLGTIISRRNELNKQRLELKQLAIHTPKLGDFISRSRAMQDLMKLTRRLVDADASVLILGETGVGKERLARAIHLDSARREGTFVAVNCGALPESLLESELFGHEEGAFTGATRARRGCFEMAHRGTILLDEIGEMPFHLQVRLLRVLQEREIQRVGGEWPIRVDVRVMAATSRDIGELVERGEFRSDLLYRLSVVRLRVPPLRERRDDIPELVSSYMEYFRKTMCRQVTGIREEALEAMLAYGWPGNVRELVNVVERAMLLGEGAEIGIEDLPEEIVCVGKPGGSASRLSGFADRRLSFPAHWFKRPLHEARDELYTEFERAYLTALLEETGGHINETAKRAGVTPRALFDKMQRCQLKKESFKPKKARRPARSS
ncbi:MAG: sigma-54-dependent Fis family transcriptional regulator [Deltaproteobacteria bacterium]|nr:sigma-54-dependent Fis family transcriptional regulator [Deltaproteobacteria bacterium]